MDTGSWGTTTTKKSSLARSCGKDPEHQRAGCGRGEEGSDTQPVDVVVVRAGPVGLLDTYTPERRPVAKAILANTVAQVAIMRPDPQAGAMRGHRGEPHATQ
jgi:hypothetical protein